MTTNNILLSYSGSGNHLVRFFIELLAERPTLGWSDVKEDVPIYNATFAEKIPFNITETSTPIFRKEHYIPKADEKVEQLILIVRDPKEVIVRQAGINLNTLVDGMLTNTQIIENHCLWYCSLVKYYIDFKGPKLLLFYEDLITKRKESIQKLYDFIQPNKPEKLEYALKNIDRLYAMSKGGKNRVWLGPKSNGTTSYYFDKLKYSSKEFLTKTVNAFLYHPLFKDVLAPYTL